MTAPRLREQPGDRERPSEIVQAERLKITEVFLSLQGESRSVGWPTVFIRLTGCPLRCTYCDSAYAFHGGEWRSIPDLVEEARACVGEPSAKALRAAERYVRVQKAMRQLEGNGSPQLVVEALLADLRSVP